MKSRLWGVVLKPLTVSLVGGCAETSDGSLGYWAETNDNSSMCFRKLYKEIHFILGFPPSHLIRLGGFSSKFQVTPSRFSSSFPHRV